MNAEVPKGWAVGDVLIAAQHTGPLTPSLADPGFSRDDNPFPAHALCGLFQLWAPDDLSWAAYSV